MARRGFVAPRGRGVASALCREARGLADLAGRLLAPPANRAARRGLFARLGWRPIERVPDSFQAAARPEVESTASPLSVPIIAPPADAAEVWTGWRH